MKRDKDAYLDAMDLKELDRLVLNELDALKRENLKEEPHLTRVWGEPLYIEDNGVKSRRDLVPPGLAEKKLDQMERNLEKTSGGLENRETWKQDNLGQSESERQVPPRGLPKEEEEFISHAVAWLRPKENKDILLTRIWSSLIGSEPKPFFSPQTEQESNPYERLEFPESEVKPGTETAEPK